MKTPHMRVINGRWRVRVVVPSALVPIIGKANLTRIIGSRDKQRDKKEASQFVAKFLAQIEDAKRHLEGEPMQHQYGLLFSGLDRHKAHRRSGHRLADRRGAARQTG